MEDFKQRITDVVKRQIAGTGTGILPFWLYFLAIVLAEILTVYLQPLAGLLCHVVILAALLIQPIFIAESQQRNLILALSLVPLIRILSLTLPLTQLPQIYWYPLIYAPLLAATIVVMRVVGLKPRHVGLASRDLFIQILLGVTSGFALGVLEYMILQPEPLITSLTLKQLWLPAIILLSTTGFGEELIFRGVLQQLSTQAMGFWRGIIYVSLIFAILHLGFFSLLDVIFVFLVALFFSYTVKNTGSLIGVTLAHGIANSLLYLVMPFILG